MVELTVQKLVFASCLGELFFFAGEVVKDKILALTRRGAAHF